MNLSNFIHAGYGLAMWLPFAIADYPIVGAAWSIAWFISREHTQRQTDIKITTGVAIQAQNPFAGFRGWSKDSKLDAWFPVIAVVVATVGYEAIRAYIH